MVLDRKTEILNTAEELLQSRGYCAFSYKDLADRLGIRKPSVHHHFSTKEDLGVGLCERFRKQFQSQHNDITERHPGSAGERFRAFVESAADVLKSDGQICALGSLQADYTVLPDRVRNEVQLLSREWNQWVAEQLGQARDAGELKFEGDPHEQAVFVCSVLQGGLQKARVEGREKFHVVVKQLLRSMGA